MINLYLLELVVNKPSAKATPLTTSHDLLHQRYGHPSKEVITRLSDAVKGVDNVGPPSDTPCDGCAKGKQHRLPFKPSNKRASRPGEGTHMDLVGPMDNSIEGYRFFAGFLDDHSSLGHTYALHHKSDQIKAFKEYRAWVENQTGQKMKWIRSDREGEYMSEEFIDLLKADGIEHNKTLPGSSQQNGCAERWNRTIMEKALCMLHFAGLSRGFWKLALDAAVHVYNCQPICRLKWQCPITAWDGTVPDVSYFRVFGCNAYVLMQKNKHHGKLDVKAVEMVFVGYELGSKGYCFWNPATRSIVVSRNVTFDETDFPARRDTSNHREVTPDNHPFPFPDSDSLDDAPDADSGDVDVPIPLELAPPPPPVPGQPPAPPPDVPPVPPLPPPPPPPVPPPHPRHCRGKHLPAVGDDGNPIPPRRSQHENAGKNPYCSKDNVYGDEPPAQVNNRTDKDGYQREAEQILLFLAASWYKAGVPNHHKDAMKPPESDKWQVAEKAEYNSLMENKTWMSKAHFKRARQRGAQKDTGIVNDKLVLKVLEEGIKKNGSVGAICEK